jgi:hypothetical protein
MIASSYSQLGWLAPHSAVVKTTPATIVQPITSSNPEEVKTILLSVAAMRQKIDELAAGQDHLTRDVNIQLQAAKQEILDKISAPSSPGPSAPLRRPAPTAQAARPR